MNMMERIKNIGHAITDGLRERISDPAQLSTFPAHLPECTRSKFLQITWQGHGIPMLSAGDAGSVTGKTITCTECDGKVAQKF